PLDLVDWLCQQSAETRLCLDPRGAQRLGDTRLSRSIALLIGPEGGFSEAERIQILRCPEVIQISLGPRILRSDTAALAALGLYQAVCGDWHDNF
ncbi:MAG: RsmE family RNA methyltransferase, partial [Candidatus Puniceispirillaceae bacterium]